LPDKFKGYFHLDSWRGEKIAKSVQCGSQNYVNALRLVISISASASDESFLFQLPESALAEIAASVPVGSAPEPLISRPSFSGPASKEVG
jgi:hypothetical protein